MAHISLYRKYRPASFGEVMGQEHVTRTLANAIATGKVSHAYLFAGSRGTGKTSTAKLLAKALNCVEGPTATPCGKCESCRAIGAGSSLDVIEMDAASNRGIDDIRDIRDRVAFATVEGKYRVYILDEAHMLTKEASNAFLKVLEEPPAHVIFVLCTTEAHKVIPTIQSRCQKFEFRRPDAGMILEVLRRIVAAEEIKIDEAGLAVIARGSGGAFRDAIGALDQLATYCEKKVLLADVLAMLGTVESELLFEAVDIAAAGDARAALLFIERLAGQGREFGQFSQELIAHLRHVFLLQQLDGQPSEIVTVSGEDLERLRLQAGRMTPAAVMRFVELLAAAYTAMRQGGDPRLNLELAFIRMTRPEVDDSRGSLLLRIEQLERGLRAGGGPAAPAAAAAAEAAKAPVATAAEAPVTTAPTAPVPPVADSPASAGEQAGPARIGASLAEIAGAWTVILNRVQKKKTALAPLLRQGRPQELEGSMLTIGFPPDAEFARSQVEMQTNSELIAAVLTEMTGASLAIKCATAAGATSPSIEKPAAGPPAAGDVPGTEQVIAMIKDEFGAEEIP